MLSEISFEFLTADVPLWFALIMALTSPYMWSKFIRQTIKTLLEKKIDEETSKD